MDAAAAELQRDVGRAYGKPFTWQHGRLAQWADAPLDTLKDAKDRQNKRSIKRSQERFETIERLRAEGKIWDEEDADGYTHTYHYEHELTPRERRIVNDYFRAQDDPRDIARMRRRSRRVQLPEE